VPARLLLGAWCLQERLQGDHAKERSDYWQRLSAAWSVLLSWGAEMLAWVHDVLEDDLCPVPGLSALIRKDDPHLRHNYRKRHCSSQKQRQDILHDKVTTAQLNAFLAEDACIIFVSILTRTSRVWKTNHATATLPSSPETQTNTPRHCCLPQPQRGRHTALSCWNSSR